MTGKLRYLKASMPIPTLSARTCNVTAKSIEASLSPRTKAIIVTHLFGNPCGMADILEVARARNVAVIEDCAHAFGASVDGKWLGSRTVAGVLSFYATKLIGGGEGGAG